MYVSESIRLNDEGGRMKDEGGALFLVLCALYFAGVAQVLHTKHEEQRITQITSFHPSSFRLHP
jgi:hypothetical protein